MLKCFETWANGAVHGDELSPGAFTEVRPCRCQSDAAGVGGRAVSMCFFPLARFWFLQMFLLVTLLSPSLKEYSFQRLGVLQPSSHRISSFLNTDFLMYFFISYSETAPGTSKTLLKIRFCCTSDS